MGPEPLSLFGKLHPDIFALFGGSNRYLYEQVLIAIYESFYRSDLHFPSRTDVVRRIYDQLARQPDLWREDEAPVQLDDLAPRRGRRIRRRGSIAADAEATSEAMNRASHIYARLKATGWIEESRYGLKVTVDMPAGAMRLAEFLCNLKEGVSEQLGGLVIQVKNGLEAVQINARENALGLNKAARDAASFGRYLRSLLSALREIDTQVGAADSIGGRLRHYFEGFVEKLLLQDYATITTTSHPYRFRHRIFELLDAIEDSVTDIGAIADAYGEARLASDPVAARDLVFDDLGRVRRVFDQIAEAFERIQQHRSRLETRLRNTVRYAGRRSGTFLQRSEAMLLQLDRLHGSAQSALPLFGPLAPRQTPLSPFLLARPRNARSPIVGDMLMLPASDPLRELRKRLDREYLDRLLVTPEQVQHYLDRQMAAFGQQEASRFRITTLDDFLAFEALRLAISDAGSARSGANAIAALITESFDFQREGSPEVENEWLRCDGFTVVRRDQPNLTGASHAD